MLHTLKHRIDAVIVSRGADPGWTGIVVDMDKVSGPYTVSSDAEGDYISSWHPPDASYGDEPTETELNAVSVSDANNAQQLERHAIAERAISETGPMAALIEATADATSTDRTVFRNAVIARFEDLEWPT